jgi:predicted permease
VDIVNLLAPIFLVIALGAALQKGGLLPADVLGGFNRLTYWVGLPVLVFVSLAGADQGEAAGTGRLVAVLLATTAAMVGVAALCARIFGVAAGAGGTFVQAAFRGNLTFVGLPLILTLPGVPQTPALLAVAPLLIAYNVVSVVVLLASRHAVGWAMLRIVGREVVRNPIIVACLLGAGAYAVHLSLPVALDRTLVQLSRMAVPLALICVGAALAATPARGGRGPAAAAAAFKAVVSPLIGYLIGRLAGLDAGGLLVVVIFAACPTAAISYTMVRQLGGDEALAAAAIVLSTIFSAFALAAALAVL